MSLIIGYRDYNNPNIINIISDTRIIADYRVACSDFNKVLSFSFSYENDNFETKTKHIFIGVTGYAKLNTFIQYLFDTKQLDFYTLKTDNITGVNIDIFLTNIVRQYIEHYQLREDSIPGIELSILTVIDRKIFTSGICADWSIDTIEHKSFATVGIEEHVATALMDIKYNPIEIFKYITKLNVSIAFPLNKLEIDFEHNIINKTVIDHE